MEGEMYATLSEDDRAALAKGLRAISRHFGAERPSVALWAQQRLVELVLVAHSEEAFLQAVEESLIATPTD